MVVGALGPSQAPLFFSVLDQHVQVQCQDAETCALLSVNHELTHEPSPAVALEYVVGKREASSAFFIQRSGQPALTAADEGEFLFLFEEDLSLAYQRLRADLYFLHAASLELNGKACLLVAPSGGGKSTTTWALLHHGFGYGGDELSPVDLQKMAVHSYPQALCLKQEPPASYPLPSGVLRTPHRLYVPTALLPAGVSRGLLPLTAIFFLHYSPRAAAPAVEPLSKAEAGVRLFANALNALAHPGEGLDGAIEIAERTTCLRLMSADLVETCLLVQATLARL
ncbi:MAG TPA: hypothetical protein VNN62_16370 [Methylomirabilota bacterium]|jgi:hypothetical protein|nr:hypothetical protein [Methylomirabilota bacterium]